MGAWVDLTVMALTFFLSIIWNIEVGVVVGLVVSLLLVVHRSSKTRMTILVRLFSSHTCMNLGVDVDVVLFFRVASPKLIDGNLSRRTPKLKRL